MDPLGGEGLRCIDWLNLLKEEQGIINTRIILYDIMSYE